MNKSIITNDNVEVIIGKQIDSTATSEEIKALEQWIAASEENEKYYQDLLNVNNWYSKNKTDEINVNGAWLKVKDRMHNESSAPPSKLKVWNYLGYAASLIVVLGAAWFLWSSQPNSKEQVQYVTNENPLDCKLDDGSVVHLTQNSALSRVVNSERSFRFSGSAKFEVKHDETRPFIVYMNEVIVKDLGTVFNIDAVPFNDTVFVKVQEGIVQFYTVDNKGILVEFGEEGMYIKSKDKFYKRSIDKKNPLLTVGFNDATFDDVVDYLSYAFRKKVSFENEGIRNCNITVDFVNAPFAEVQEIVEETLNITIQKKEDTIHFSGNSCK